MLLAVRLKPAARMREEGGLMGLGGGGGGERRRWVDHLKWWVCHVSVCGPVACIPA